MSNATAPASSGIGLGGVVFIVFLVLKLTGFIAWSWWWITAPLWIPLAIAAVIMLVVGVIALLSVWADA